MIFSVALLFINCKMKKSFISFSTTGIRLIFLTHTGRSNKTLKAIQFPIFLETTQVKNQMLLNKINLIVTAMAVLMLGLIPVVYAHNKDWNDGFKY